MIKSPDSIDPSLQETTVNIQKCSVRGQPKCRDGPLSDDMKVEVASTGEANGREVLVKIDLC